MIQSTPEQLKIDRRRAIVAEQYLTGRHQHEIAAELGVDQATVSRDIKAVRQQWRESARQYFSEWQDRELQLLDRIEAEAWGAWERSKKDAEQIKLSEGGEYETSETTLKGQCGDPRFLQTIQECSAKRCAILGLEAPKKIETNAVQFLTRDKMASEVRERLNALMQTNQSN